MHSKMIKTLILGSLLSSSCVLASMESAESASTKGYVGIFGGFAGKDKTNFAHFGTVFALEAAGGPLGVNAFGELDSDSTGMLGLHFGFSWPKRCSPVTPALEFEGYCLKKINPTGEAVNNITRALTFEHIFSDTYPLKTTVFLINGILNGHCFLSNQFTPYIGFGIGSALGSISGATSFQLDSIPDESSIDHFNGDPDSRSVTFAAQLKAGLGFNLCSQLKMFAEYRFLYLAQADYTFGSTSAPGHYTTSPWTVNINPQHYNMAIIGIDFSF